MIRAFIALELKDEDTIKSISSFTSRMKQNQTRVKIIEPQNLHLTVKFLGDISESVSPKIYKILQEEINETLFKGKTFEYKLTGAGQFSKFSVLWIGLKGDIGFLQKIKDTIENKLNTQLKIQKDKRTQFKPHLTIGRLRNNRTNYKTFDSFKNLINENKQKPFGTFSISEIKLKKSVLTQKGPIYSDLVF